MSQRVYKGAPQAEETVEGKPLTLPKSFQSGMAQS